MCPPIFEDVYNLKPTNKYTLRDNDFCENCSSPFVIMNAFLNLYVELISKQFVSTYRRPFLWNRIVQGKFDFPEDPSFPLFKCKLKEILFSLENVTTYF